MAAAIVKSETMKPCGCMVTVMSDDTSRVLPCIPCALIGAAQQLAQAAHCFAIASQALSAAGQRAHLNRTIPPLTL